MGADGNLKTLDTGLTVSVLLFQRLENIFKTMPISSTLGTVSYQSDTSHVLPFSVLLDLSESNTLRKVNRSRYKHNIFNVMYIHNDNKFKIISFL